MSNASVCLDELDRLLVEWPVDVNSEPFNNAELDRRVKAQAAKARAEREGMR